SVRAPRAAPVPAGRPRRSARPSARAPARRCGGIGAVSDPLVAAVVLNWNGLSDTRGGGRSPLAPTQAPPAVWGVAHTPAHGEADALEREFGARIVLLRCAENSGFAGGCNRALERILAAGRAVHVALLNNDAVADRGWLAALVAALERAPAAGSAASKMVF